MIRNEERRHRVWGMAILAMKDWERGNEIWIMRENRESEKLTP